MKKIIFAMVALLPLLTGCSKDENNTLDLYQTVWSGKLIAYDASEEYSEVTETFVLEFISETEGSCALQELNVIQPFRYTLTGSILSINGSMAVCGDWYIVSHSRNEITLQAYQPYKMVIKLKRIY